MLIPQLTRGWQNHAKILEVKTNLVADMSDSVGSTTMTGRFIASGLIGKATADPNATQRAFNDARQSHNDASADYARSLYTIEATSGAEPTGTANQGTGRQ